MEVAGNRANQAKDRRRDGILRTTRLSRAILLRVALVAALWVVASLTAPSPTVLATPEDASNADTSHQYGQSPQFEPRLPTEGIPLWRDAFDYAPDGQLSEEAGDGIFAPTAAGTGADTYASGRILADPQGGKFLRQMLPSGELGKFIVTPKLKRPAEHAVISYEIRFDENFDFRWGGKIPGLVGVAPGKSIYAPTSGNPDRSVGFSARLMWHGRGDDGTRPFQHALGPIPEEANNDIVTYIYATSPSSGFDHFGWQARLGGEFKRGEWHRIAMEVKLNSLGERNGLFRVWVDDHLLFSADDWEFRIHSDVKINAVLYDVHRGGREDENWISKRDSYIDIRNMVVLEPYV